jgi:PTH1 family peptidyl-tRNA hydrolase
MWNNFWKRITGKPKVHPGENALLTSQWLLVPLGNPGDDYSATRHNLGRLMLQRWMGIHSPEAQRVRAFRSGNLYALEAPFLALVPATYMNLSGQACAEAVAEGYAPGRMILLHDDKDLPLGLGRFRLTGGSAGHNGLASVCERLGSQDLARLRLGIGPCQRPLHEFVLGEWTEEEWRVIEGLDAPFARFMALLAKTENLADLPAIVNAASYWNLGSAPSQ